MFVKLKVVRRTPVFAFILLSYRNVSSLSDTEYFKYICHFPYKFQAQKAISLHDSILLHIFRHYKESSVYKSAPISLLVRLFFVCSHLKVSF